MAVKMIAASAETVAETVGRNLIANYGLSWRLGDTEWTHGHLRLVGKRAGRKPANFWDQDGFYILYLKRQVHYVGVSHRLGHRLRVHTKDRHKDLWDEFHWFGFRRVSDRADQKGFLELEDRVKQPVFKIWRVRGDIEAVLGLLLPGLAQKRPNFGAKGVEKVEADARPNRRGVPRWLEEEAAQSRALAAYAARNEDSVLIVFALQGVYESATRR